MDPRWPPALRSTSALSLQASGGAEIRFDGRIFESRVCIYRPAGDDIKELTVRPAPPVVQQQDPAIFSASVSDCAYRYRH